MVRKGLKQDLFFIIDEAMETHVEFFFYVTVEGILVTCVTAHTCRCTRGLQCDLWSGFHAIDISQDSVKCPSKHQHGTSFFDPPTDTLDLAMGFNLKPNDDLAVSMDFHNGQFYMYHSSRNSVSVAF